MHSTELPHSGVIPDLRLPPRFCQDPLHTPPSLEISFLRRCRLHTSNVPQHAWQASVIKASLQELFLASARNQWMRSGCRCDSGSP